MGRNVVDDLLPMNRQIRKEGGHHERVEKPVSCTMVLKTSRSFCSQVSQAEPVRDAAPQHWEGAEGAVSPTRGGIGGGACDGRSRSSMSEYCAEVQRCEHGGISQGQVGDPDSPRVPETQEAIYGVSLLGPRLLRQYDRAGRASDSGIHPESRSRRATARVTGIGGSLGPFMGQLAPSEGLHHTARSAGGS